MKFETIIFQKGNNLGIEVPEAIIEQLGAGKRPPVTVTIKGYQYKSTVGVMGGKFLIPLSSEHRRQVAISGGETTEIEILLDTAPRTVELPEVLKEKLKGNGPAEAFFESLSPSNQKKIVALIETAKTAATRSKRLEEIISALSQQIKP